MSLNSKDFALQVALSLIDAMDKSESKVKVVQQDIFAKLLKDNPKVKENLALYGVV